MIKWEFAFEQGSVVIYPTTEEDARFSQAMLPPEATTALIRMPAIKQDVYINMHHVKVVSRTEMEVAEIAPAAPAEPAEVPAIDVTPIPPTA